MKCYVRSSKKYIIALFNYFCKVSKDKNALCSGKSNLAAAE